MAFSPVTNRSVATEIKDKVKVKPAVAPSGHQAGAYFSFCSIKRVGVFPLHIGWDASPSQG